MPRSTVHSEADFEAFYDRHYQYVYRLCYTYMKSQADAEDCAEDVFVKVLTGDFSFQDETHERKWLTVTAGNLCKDRLKSHARQDTSIDDEPEITAEEQEDHSEVLEAILSLPPKYKEVILMFYYDGYQTEEIAQMLERPPSTVRNQLKDARERLKKMLGGEYGDGA